ncbi:MAG TPA: hypothetical protein VHW66_03530 [Stellaceae bacterium]|jgi:hypothetical protein|nr:hypothetical protein [Stellaceae bacterium]
MSHSYFTMWGLLILMGLAAFDGLNYRGEIKTTLAEAYPTDPAKQNALRRCGAADRSFSKFFADDRKACYRVLLPSALIPASGESGKSS